MHETTQSGGLFGLIARAVSGAKSGVASGATAAKHSSLTDPLHWIIRATLSAGMILVYKKAQANPEWTDAAVGMLLGTAALLCEYYMGGEIVRAWFDRSITRILSSSGVYAFALGFAFLQWTGTASEMEDTKSGIQRSAYIVQEDMGKTEAELTAKNNDLLQRISLAPQRGPEAALAAMDRAAADPLWKVTAKCTENASGKKARAFCDAYASAVADLEAGKNLATWREEQKVVARELSEVRSKRAKSGPAVASAERADLRMLVSYGGMTEQAAKDLSAVWKIMIISVLALLLGMMAKAREYRDQPKKPWGFARTLAAAVNWLSRALFGRDVVSSTTIKNYMLDGTVYTRSDVNPLNVIGTKVATT